MAALRGSWSDLASKMAETKLAIDNCIHRWASFAEEVKQLDKVIEAVLKNFQECDQPQRSTTLGEKRAEVDFLRNLQERLRAERPEVEQMRTKTLQLQSQGPNSIETIFKIFKFTSVSPPRSSTLMSKLEVLTWIKNQS